MQHDWWSGEVVQHSSPCQQIHVNANLFLASAEANMLPAWIFAISSRNMHDWCKVFLCSKPSWHTLTSCFTKWIIEESIHVITILLLRTSLTAHRPLLCTEHHRGKAPNAGLAHNQFP